MTALTRRMFANNCYGVPKEKRGHVPTLILTASGTGLRCICSCGHRISRATGCNRAGIGYAIAAAHGAYKKHVEEAEHAANARLIVAAPDLLDGCRKSLAWLEITGAINSELKAQLRDAIGIAEGRG